MYSNLSLQKDSQSLLMKANESNLQSIFDQLKPINNRISFTDLLLFYESLSIVPAQLSFSKLSKYVDSISVPKSSESNVITFSQFKQILSIVAKNLFSFSSNHVSSLEILIKHIKNLCKTKYNVELIEDYGQNAERQGSIPKKKSRFLSNSISKYNLRPQLDEITLEVSEKRNKKTASVVSLKKIHTKIRPKILTSTEKDLQSSLIVDLKKFPKDPDLHIVPLSFPKASTMASVKTAILEKFENFKNSVEKIMKSNQKYYKKKKKHLKFVVKNRKKLASQDLVARIIFLSWKNYVFNR